MKATPLLSLGRVTAVTYKEQLSPADPVRYTVYIHSAFNIISQVIKPTNSMDNSEAHKKQREILIMSFLESF